jgi:hypothetical protein
MKRIRRHDPEQDEYDPLKEPVYVENIDERHTRRPKWMTPPTPFQREFLASVGRKYFQFRNERSQMYEIESKTKIQEGESGLMMLPEEWVNFCMDWARKKRLNREMVGLQGLISFVLNEDAKQNWISSKGRVKKE